MLRSAGFSFFVAGVMTLLMFIPQFFAAEVINSRGQYSRATISDVSREWGGPQRFGGPLLVVPVSAQVTQKKRVEVIDPVTGMVMVDPVKGQPRHKYVEETVTETRAPVYLFPERLDARISNQTEERHRGLFNVPVYRGQVAMDLSFDAGLIADALTDGETADWDAAELRLPLGNNRALRGNAALTADGQEFLFEPLSNGASGLKAELGDPRKLSALQIEIGFNGAQSLWLTPVGRVSQISMQSDWPHPSFTGAFLPDRSEISEAGFDATWTIPHLALALPHVSRESPSQQLREQGTFGIEFYQPNDFYQKAFRASRYGILFIALTFLTVLLVEDRKTRPTHPVQYLMIGLAQSLFVVLMVAFAEQIGFGEAYVLAAGATIGLITFYGITGLKLGRRAWVLGGALGMIYAVLYLILQTADFALLAGALLGFCALAAAMFLTRNEDWYGKPGNGPRWFARKPKAPVPQTPSAQAG
ncbi:cell envelope integrity protein CreD [Actibacterium ureilyticum]|uniref:cell envelope integrity protein CreD n=1 Tax=Actibacterium ureilyticum TaxID=1590614 RepID=UPI000BAAD13A|nr:cell envelope integrity protein CreD [Actibacterium ureilyticum]